MHPDLGISADRIRRVLAAAVRRAEGGSEPVATGSDEFREAWDKIRSHFGPVFGEVVRILAEEDPISLIWSGAPKDEYEPEAVMILARLHEAASQRELRRIAYEEFASLFDADLAGRESDYERIARRIWAVAESKRETE